MYSRTNASSRPTVDTKYPRAQKLCPTKFCFRPPYTRARCIALFPLINPITCATAYFGGIEIIMCTWSGSRCPSSIRLSFCSASLRNTSPKYFLSSPYNAFRRPFGINTTWYLHSHFEWLKLSCSSIQFLLCVCFAAHARSFLDGLPYLSNFACLPGRAGGTPISLALVHFDDVLQGSSSAGVRNSGEPQKGGRLPASFIAGRTRRSAKARSCRSLTPGPPTSDRWLKSMDRLTLSCQNGAQPTIPYIDPSVSDHIGAQIPAPYGQKPK